jgi:hypothetical protein
MMDMQIWQTMPPLSTESVASLAMGEPRDGIKMVSGSSAGMTKRRMSTH